LLSERTASNTVLQSGGRIIDLFAGAGAPIALMGVGGGDQPFSQRHRAGFDRSSQPGLTGATATAIPAAAFRIELTSRAGGWWSDRDAARRGGGRDARRPRSLSAGTAATCWPTVVFRPWKGDDHDLSLFWRSSSRSATCRLVR
jgi:hypothetical protein